MELIEAELTEFSRRSRSLVVAHSEAGLARGLEYGERVLVRSAGEYRTAVVADVDFELAETRYRLVLGVRVPVELAESRLVHLETRPVGGAAGPVSVHDVAEMLAKPRVPLQRRMAHRLQQR